MKTLLSLLLIGFTCMSFGERRGTHRGPKVIKEAQAEVLYLNPSPYGTKAKRKIVPRFNPSKLIVPKDMTDDQIESVLAERALISAVQARRNSGLSAYGYYDPKICAETRDASKRMAKGRRQDGIPNFEKYVNRFVGAQGGTAHGTTAESKSDAGPPNRSNPKYKDKFNAYKTDLLDHLKRHARDCANSWRNKKSVKIYSHRFCYSMVRGKNNRYYCTGLFTNADFPDKNWQKRLFASSLYN